MRERREFLKSAGAGLLATRVSHRPGSPPHSVEDWYQVRGVEPPRFGRKKAVTGKQGMAISSHPIVTRTAIDILRAGGNACDAILAASVAQTVAEPHMTTITGVLSMLYFDRATGRTTYINGGMNAPLAKLPGFSPADLRTGRGAGVPGFWGGFEAALAQHGAMARSALLKPAIDLARNGFPIHPFLYAEMFAQLDTIGITEAGRRIFMPQGTLLLPGELLRQAEAADTLERLAADGTKYFYHGEFARKYCEVVKAAGGVITPEDFERYEARHDQPAKSSYRGYDVIASPPPDNGGTHVIEALNMMELLDIPKWGPADQSPDTLYQMIQIHNEVFTAGGRQTDPASHRVPLEVIVSKEYARTRLDLLRMGDPPAADKPAPPPGSNHLTVVDGKGNVATVLHSVMALPWSNGLFVGGFGIAASGGHFLRVMPNPGDRASAYVAPVLMLKGGRPVLACGSPSVGLLANILQNIVNVFDLGSGIETAVHRPRFGGVYLGPGNYIEADVPEKVRNAVAARGVPLNVCSPWHFMNGSFEGIVLDPTSGTMSACGDPRRNATAEAV